MRSVVMVSFLASALAVGAAASAAPPAKAKGPSFLEDATQVVAAFKAKIPAPFLVTELTISPTSASIEVQDPRQKDTYDEYRLSKDTGFSEPEPQQVFSVTCKKGFDGRVPRMEYRLSAAGRRALERYLANREAWIKWVGG